MAKYVKYNSGGTRCALAFCKSVYVNNDDTSYLSFPKDPVRCGLWVKKCNPIFLPTTDLIELAKKHKLCSLHFESKMFSNFQKNRLFQQAIPTIFDSQSKKRCLEKLFGMTKRKSNLITNQNDQTPDDSPTKGVINDLIKCDDKKQIVNTHLQETPTNHIYDIKSESSSSSERIDECELIQNEKRSKYLSWDDFFMATAFLAAKRSKDPVTQVGACIVTPEKKIVGTGYNGMPIGCNDNHFPWGKSNNSKLDNKYFYVCHAEMNAVLNKNSSDVRNCIMYVALFPCNECAKIIIQSGIKEVVYLSDKYAHKLEMIAAKRMFNASGVSYRQYIPSVQRLVLDFSEINSNMTQMPDTPSKLN